MSNKSSKIIEKEFKNLRKELLDLTLRNQLLNFKSRAKTITIVNQTPLNIFQTLVLQENKMYFVANKKDKKEDKSSVWDHIPFDFSKFSEGDKKLSTDLTPKELQKRLYYINNQAKTMLQEQGYNILYLAVGFLQWRDKSKPRQKNNAPLILIPVSMERKKIGESFNLEWTGEDIQTNISLKAKLMDAGIELPDFEFKKYGEVIDHYISNVKRSVSRMDGWEVNNNIALGFFSFTKFVMYNDLNPDAWADNVDLTKNELIQAIFNPAKNKQEAFREEDIDSQLEYQNMYQVLDADSSQIAAIQDVKAGRNLVVEGPPGTGKSQTIVNLIAELLAEGKSVLFVSEKMAALDVVKDRLTNVGLGKFVLELHSHKTRRRKFLKDLQKATNVRSNELLDIDNIIRKLETLRRQLDDYSQIIHQPVFEVNLSAYELYGMKESADDHFAKKNLIMPLVRFENPEAVSLKDLDDMKIALENLAELYQTISKENPWSKCAPKSLLPADLREIEMLINDSLISLDNFLVERGRVYDIYGIKKPDSLNEFKNSLSAFQIFKSKNSELIDSSIIKSGAWNNNDDEAFKLIQELEIYQKQSKKLSKFNQSIFQADIDRLRYELQQISSKKFRFFNNKQHIDLVERYYAVPVSGSVDDIINDLNEAKQIINLKNKLEANNLLGQKYFGDYWYLNANIDDLKAIANWMHEFSNLVREGTFSKNTIELLSKDLYDINPERDLSEYIDSGEEFVRVLSRLKNKLNPKTKLIFKREAGDVDLEAWKEQLYAWRGQLSSLHLWSQYLNTKNSLKNSNAKMFVDSIEKRNIHKEDIEALVEGNFADSLLNILFVENQELAVFVGELHENRIKEFKDLDKKILLLNRKRIFHKLNSNIPKIFGGTENPQAKILAGEFTRKSGHMPVRKLLEKAGGMIKQIKPCFMMSPLSIAQYLDPTNEELQFDVVIFDEASQVKPEDALGAFMRGKSAVVMGDTQQLPPTSFFDQMSGGDSDEEEATSLDMESILHLCKLSFPVKMLKWHYRSRHESLITVSNREFYDNDLLVYPSPSHSDPELGLKFHYNPNTSYDRGSSSANPLEAQDVVDEIFNHFEKYGDTKSLGVGTFSVAQKNAILEALEVKRKQHPEYEPLFSDNKEERFFVKNLETIQGDERDVILISVGYGYDRDRKMSLNFGPLNQDGGERRLNVLITRAREKCVVFSNFKAYDMHLTSNPPYGVKALKEFLAYAENLTLGHHETESYAKEPFEDAIASFLEENGYSVDRQIGYAGFRVDLAIIDDENPGKYILGITTDGKMYSSSKVARDRDRLREQVLAGLGWKLYHLWSTDWYRNRDLGRKKLLDFVENSIRETREEEKRRSEEERKLAEKRRKEAQKKAEELRLAREREEAEKKAKEKDESFEENISSNDFVVDDNYDDILEKPTDISNLNPSDLFDDDSLDDVSDVEFDSGSDDVSLDDVGDVEFDSGSDDVSLDASNIIKDDSDKGNIDNDSDIIDENLSENSNNDINSNSISEMSLDESENSTFSTTDSTSVDEDMDNNEYSTDNISEDSKSVKDKIKSFISPKSSKSDDNSFFNSLKFKKDINNESKLNDELEENNFDSFEINDDVDNIEEKIIDESQKDNQSMSDTSNVKFSNVTNIDSVDDVDESSSNDVTNNESDVNNKNENLNYKSPHQNNLKENTDLNNNSEDETEEKNMDVKKDAGNSNVIYDVVNDKNIQDSSNNQNEDISLEMDDGNSNVIQNNVNDEKIVQNYSNKKRDDIDENIVDLDSDEDYIYVEHDDNNEVHDNDMDENIVDLGSDEDYIYVEHDEEDNNVIQDNIDDKENLTDISVEESENKLNEKVQKTPKKHNFVKSFISDVINGESQLEPKNIQTVRGEIIEEDMPLHKPTPTDESVVDVEFEDNLNSPSFKKDSIGDGDELNIFTDDLPDVSDKNNTNILNIVDNAKKHYLDDVFDNLELNDENINYDDENIQDIESIDNNENNDEPIDDGISYYKGANDVHSKLRKNNFYYENVKPKSVRESIKGIKKDVRYINKSLKEIENPTQIDYVSVIDRTEEYNPDDYLNRPSDDDSHIILQKEDELTFAEKEEIRIQKEMEDEKNNINEINDQVLEDIIQTADEDYKKIEKERFQQNNKLKSFDNHKLTNKKKIEDNIVDYVESSDFGLNSQDDLYNQPIDKVAESVKVIVETENPIHINELNKRIKNSCNIKRANVNLKKTVYLAVEKAESNGEIVKIGDFIYDSSDRDIVIRRRNKPNIDLISDEEIAKSIELVLTYKSNVSTGQIPKETSRNFGFKSTSKKTASRINSVLDLMIAEGKVKIEKDIVELM